jgi:spore maturation protein CgeB
MYFLNKVNNKLGIIKNKEEIQQNYVKSVRNAKANVKEDKHKRIKDINAAVILDEFSYNSFRVEFNCHVLTPDNWRQIFNNNDIDVFFCESAWSGTDSKKRPWKGQIYASVNFKNENRTQLLEIIDYCKENGITTIFWNKEDPTHYSDRIHDFVKTALLFDHIFTTAEECVELYKKDYGHNSVHSLMFASQPKMFNPIQEDERTKDIVFAGSWYKQHPSRCKEMERIFDTIIKKGYNLKIYDRHSGVDDENHVYPQKYHQYIYPAVPFDQMARVYKESEYALNITTVTNSNTMFARRVFELMSSNTCVLSNYFKGIDTVFDGCVIVVDDQLDLTNSIEIREKNLYDVLRNHTYADRAKRLFDCIGFSYIDEVDDVRIYYLINNAVQIEQMLKHSKTLEADGTSITLLLGDDIEPTKISKLYSKYNNSKVEVRSMHFLTKYAEGYKLDAKYFALLNGSEPADFISRALVHFRYLDDRIGVKHSDIQKGKFGIVSDNDNMSCVFCESQYDIVFKAVLDKAAVSVEKMLI